MEKFIGLKIRDFFCNGFFGRVYDLEGSTIIHAGIDYLVIRTEEGDVRSTQFGGWSFTEIEELVQSWVEEENHGD